MTLLDTMLLTLLALVVATVVLAVVLAYLSGRRAANPPLRLFLCDEDAFLDEEVSHGEDTSRNDEVFDPDVLFPPAGAPRATVQGSCDYRRPLEIETAALEEILPPPRHIHGINGEGRGR